MPSRRAGAMGETGRTQMSAALCALPRAARGQAGGMDAKNEKVVSDTPRTDALFSNDNRFYATVDAKELCAALEKENAELARDKARLDWYFSWNKKPESFVRDYLRGTREQVTLTEWRAIIDAAMQPQPARKD